ncbi:MAG TPA: cytochrome P460 family protein [Pyrinomonadaceae bacterium]|nr:cytochrome P460 family protein [Pyrinomonadaceae bacterium]
MAENFRKFKIAVVAAGLACALAFLVNHLSASAVVPVREKENSLAGDKPVKEIKGYKNWTKVNAAPQLMPGRIAAACAIWLGAGGVVIDGEGNPHRHKYFTVYVNDTGGAAMLNQKSPKFPEGSVIVKEKLTAKDSQTPELLTVMIKRHEGFNPESGDWEYMVVDGTGTKIEGRGKLENCQGCHLSNQKTDYIFRTYLSDEAERVLK